jgi:C4-dicarboxylate-specific signal transduction histidine kinase
MAAQGFVQTLARSLRLRVLALVLCGFALFCVPAYFAFSAVVNATIFQLGTLFAEKQVLYDRYRGLETLMREVSLAETLAGSEAIRDWASNETDPQARRRGLAELEHYRRAFADNSYFFVIDASGNYYFNDAANAYASNQLRYTVSADNPRDGWYFTTRALGSGCHLNVDHDDNLRVTKVWMNCVIREGRRVLGILGTGIDLTAFIREVVDVPQPGVNAMFIDRTGAIQAHRNPELVDFHSLTKAMSSKSTVFAMLDLEADRIAMREMLDSLAADPGGVRSRFMQVDGRTVLVGAGYLDRLGWFNVTLMDVDEIIDRHLFAPIAALLAVLMLGIALVLMLIFKRSVLDRLAGIASGVRQVEQGCFEEAARLSAPGTDEIARLGQSLATMARAVGETTRELEQRVAERTRELERLAYMDGLTGIANRRGLTEVFVRGMGQRQWLGFVETACLGPLFNGVNEPPTCLANEYRFRLAALEQSRMAGENRFYTVSAYASTPDPNYADEPGSAWALAVHQAYAPRIDGDDEMAGVLNAEVDRLLAEAEANKTTDLDTGADTHLSVRIDDVSRRRISLKINDWWYGHGAAHGNYAITYLHVLSEPARVLGTEDVFDTEGWQTALAGATLESLKATLGDILWEMEAGDLVDIVADPTRWTFAERGLTIQFQPYEVSAYAFGAPTTTVSWDRLEDFTTSEAYTLSWE